MTKYIFINVGGLHPDCEIAMLVKEPGGHLHGSSDEHHGLYIDLEFIDWAVESGRVYTTLKFVPKIPEYLG
jgi:hypothetical protein